MSFSRLVWLSAVVFLFSAGLCRASDAPVASWHAQSLWQSLGFVVLYSLVGIATAILGYKLFDLCTPGRLHEEIIAHKNTAAAIIGGSVILGVCIIIAAAIVG